MKLLSQMCVTSIHLSEMDRPRREKISKDIVELKNKTEKQPF